MRRIASLLVGVLVLFAPAWAGAQSSGPDTVSVSGPASPASDPTPTFEFSSPDAGAHFECRLGSGAWAGCRSPTVLGPLADGAYHFEVRAVSAGGTADATPLAYDIVIDTAVPDTSIAGPDSTATDRPTFVLSSTKPDPVFECRLDGAVWDACGSPYVTPALDDGPHRLEVRASDHLNHTDGTPAAVGWTVRVPEATPTPRPAPTATPAPTVAPGPARDLGRLPGSLVAAGRCQALAGGTHTESVEVRKVGRFDVRFKAPVTAGGPIVVTLRGPRLAAVTYGVDGLATTAGLEPPYRLSLGPPELAGDTEHVLIVRVRAPGGRPRTVTLGFTTERCATVLTVGPDGLRVDSRTAVSEVSFAAAGVQLDGGRIVVGAFGRQDRQFALGPLGGERGGVVVTRERGRVVIRGLPPQTGIIALQLAQPITGDGLAARIVAGGKILRF